MLSIYLSMLETEEEQKKFTLLYEKYKDLMLKVAYQYVNDYRLTEDCVHDAFLGIAKHIHTVGNVNDDKTMYYLLTVTRAVAINMYKREQRERHFVDFDNDGSKVLSPTLEEDYFHYEDKKMLARMIKELPDEFRDIMILRYGYGLSYNSIADMTMIKPAAARKRVQRAKELMRQRAQRE